jgi:hypothetical protein
MTPSDRDVALGLLRLALVIVVCGAMLCYLEAVLAIPGGL